MAHVAQKKNLYAQSKTLKCMFLKKKIFKMKFDEKHDQVSVFKKLFFTFIEYLKNNKYNQYILHKTTLKYREHKHYNKLKFLHP